MSEDQNNREVYSTLNHVLGTIKARKVEENLDLDHVLTNELGQFGWFQLRNILLVAVPIAMSPFMSEFVFSAAAVPHSCERYVSANSGTNSSLDYNCPSNLFDQRETVGCDRFVYARENSVVYEFDLECQDFLRALAGTLNNIGILSGLPITGYFSDRFGRKWALIISVFNLGLIGLIRAFSVNFTMYMALQMLQTMLGAGTFSSAYIFAAELVGPKYRVATSATLFSMYAVGQVILGGVAWLIQPWRLMILALHIPCLLIVCYYWFLSESVRWLLSKKKYTEARTILEKVAQVNKTFISEKSMESLMFTTEDTEPTDTNYWHGMPSMMYAAMGILSGVLVMTQPETLGTKMPDTLSEAEALGRKSET